jgi:2'-5' RNA ligase
VPETDAPYLVTLGFDPSTFERLDRLRSRYFPSHLNQVSAHLSLFHHLPGVEGETIDRTLFEVAKTAPIVPLAFPTVKRTGRGMMLPVEAPGLLAIHAKLARTFARWLTPQDLQPFRAHVTIMNKADRDTVDAAFGELTALWSSWDGQGDRLILWRYLGGPWDEVESYALSGVLDSPTIPIPRDPGAAPR